MAANGRINSNTLAIISARLVVVHRRYKIAKIIVVIETAVLLGILLTKYVAI